MGNLECAEVREEELPFLTYAVEVGSVHANELPLLDLFGVQLPRKFGHFETTSNKPFPNSHKQDKRKALQSLYRLGCRSIKLDEADEAITPQVTSWRLSGAQLRFRAGIW